MPGYFYRSLQKCGRRWYESLLSCGRGSNVFDLEASSKGQNHLQTVRDREIHGYPGELAIAPVMTSSGQNSAYRTKPFRTNSVGVRDARKAAQAYPMYVAR